MLIYSLLQNITDVSGKRRRNLPHYSHTPSLLCSSVTDRWGHLDWAEDKRNPEKRKKQTQKYKCRDIQMNLAKWPFFLSWLSKNNFHSHIWNEPKLEKVVSAHAVLMTAILSAGRCRVWEANWENNNNVLPLSNESTAGRMHKSHQYKMRVKRLLCLFLLFLQPLLGDTQRNLKFNIFSSQQWIWRLTRWFKMVQFNCSWQSV